MTIWPGKLLLCLLLWTHLISLEPIFVDAVVLEPREAAISQDTNDTVHKNNFSSPVSKPRKTKQEKFNNFDEEQRAKVGRNAVSDGVARATNRFMAERSGASETGIL